VGNGKAHDEESARRGYQPTSELRASPREKYYHSPQDTAVRVFISYSHDSAEHKDRVWDLCEGLRKDGVDCRIDQHEDSPPEGWPRWSRNQVQESQFVIVVCTETYKLRYEGKAPAGEGKGVKWEGFIITQELYEADGRNTKFIPVVFSSHDSTHIPLELQGATRYDVSTSEAYDNLFRHLSNQPAREKSPVAPRLRPMPLLDRRQQFCGPLWNVPYSKNPFFTGREKVLADVERELYASGLAALTGMGGVGKTQTAAEFAHEHRDEYSAVLWVSAASQDTLASDFAAIASLLNLPEKDEKEQALAVAAVKRWLAANAGWLLIFDNASDLAKVHGFIPRATKGHVLLTTQAQATGDIQAIEVRDMLPEEGALLLLRRAKITRADAPLSEAGDAARDTAANTSKELGGLPLALDQAGAYIEETGCGLVSYLDLYRTRRADLLKRRGGFGPDHPESVATTVSLSFEKVAEASHAAADLLRFCAFLHPDAIPEEIFTKGAAELGTNLSSIAADPLELNTACAEILKYSLVRRDADAKTMDIHRLVQEVIRDGLTEEEKRQWAERAVRAINQAFPSVGFANWARCERLVPQALVCATLIEACGFEFEEAARLLDQGGYYLYERARFSDTEPLYQRALAIRERVQGPDHPGVAMTLNNLAELYREQGKFAKVEPLCQRALAIRERVLGPDHPDVAMSLNNLAELYREQGKHAQAEPLCQRALAINAKTLGPDHPRVATSLNNLAELYREQGKYAQAEPLCQRALATTEKTLGLEHPTTAIRLNNLGALYVNQGKYAEAETLYWRALGVTEKALGPEHPDVAARLNNLALLYKIQGKYGLAEPLYQRALAIKKKAVGPDHPDVATSLNNLAGLYRAQGKHAEADRLYESALAIWEKALGPDHPNVATVLENRALLLREMKRGAAARELEARAAAMRAVHAKTNPPG
jgi:tetratricopeptide (TPR) repeat protein